MSGNSGLHVLMLITIGIPFAVNIGNVAIITAFIYSLYLMVFKKQKVEVYSCWYIIWPLIFFLIIFFSALTSYNIREGIKQLDKSLLLILLPICLGVLYTERRYLKPILMSFVYSTGLASFLLLVYGIFRVLKTGRGDVMFFHEFTALYDQHPVYFAIYCAMSVFIATHYYSCFSRVSKLGVIAINLLLGVVLLLTSSKAILLVFAVLYPIQLALYIKNAKMRLISIFALLTLGILSVINIPFLQERFVEGLTLNYTSFQPTHDVGEAFVFGNDDKHNLSDLDLRYIFWRLALFHLNDDGKLLLGYGVGDVQDHLDLYYMYYGLAPGWFEGYNVHNQYLQILASMGILGLLLFCFYLWKSVTVANRNKSFLHLAFLGTMLFAFCFESYLSRNKGIVLFVFFNTLLIKDYYLNEIRDHRNQGDTK